MKIIDERTELLRERDELKAELERLREENKLLKDSFSFLGVDPETNMTEVDRLHRIEEAARNINENFEAPVFEDPRIEWVEVQVDKKDIAALRAALEEKP